MPSELARIQERFYSLVTAPQPLAEAAALAGLGPNDLAELVMSDARLDASDRLGIYANMYFLRLRDVLAQQFPVLRGFVEADHFHNLAVDYLAACRPAHPSLRNLGSRLPGFVATHALAESRPWLAEVALLEWTLIDLFDGADASVLALEDVRELGGEAFAELPLAPIPCLRLVPVRHRIDACWAEPPEPPVSEPTTILVWRPALEVEHRPVEEEEAALLRTLMLGTTPAQLCERMAEQRSEDDAATEAFGLLARWISAGLIRKP